MSFLKIGGSRITLNNKSISLDAGAIGPVDTEDPTIPQNVAALVTVNQVTLTWDPATDNVAVLGYRIFRDGIQVGTTLFTNVFVESLPVGSYDYQVVTVDTSFNESAPSTVLTVTVSEIPDEPPTVPTNVNVSYNGTTHVVTVTWTASTDEIGVLLYVIYRNGNPVAFAGPSPYTETLTASGTYSYQVSAVDVSGLHSALSAADSVTVTITPPADTEAPTEPTGVTATWNGSQVNVTWHAATDNVGVALYWLYRNGAVLTFGNALTYKDTVPGPGTYTYEVAASDAAGNVSGLSDPATVVVPATGNVYSPEAWAAAQVPPVTFPGDDTEDVSAKMAAFFATVPKTGATVNFKAFATYHMEEQLTLLKYEDLTINFNGATFHAHAYDGGTPLAQEYPYRNRSNLRLHNCTDVVLNNPRMQGAMAKWNNGGLPIHQLVGNPPKPKGALNPDPLQWDSYQVEVEAQHGIWISGGNRITINGGKITDVFGDFIALERGNGDTVPNQVTIDGLVGRRNGRQGFGVSACTNLIIRNTDLNDCRRAWVDLEPGSPTKDFINGVNIHNNTCRFRVLNWVSSAGQGHVDNVTISNNQGIGSKCNVFCQSNMPARRSNWTVTNNTADTKAAGKSCNTFTNVDHLTVTGNVQQLNAGMYYSFIRDCTDVTTANPGVTGISGVTGDGDARYEHFTTHVRQPGPDGILNTADDTFADLYLAVGYSPDFTV